MRIHPSAHLRRVRGRTVRTSKSRRTLFERLEDRATPAVGLGYAFSLGGAAFDASTSVAADSAGNVYVAGSFNGTVDFDPGPGVFNLSSTGAADAFLAEYSSSGTLLWAGQIVDAGPINTYRLGLTIGSEGDVYLTGQFSGTTDFDLGAGVSTLTTGSRDAAFVARYTPAGGLAWARRLGGGTASLLGNTIAVDSSGNVYTAGVMSNGSADLDPGTGTFNVTNSTGNANTYLSKLDAAGDFVWGGMLANDPSIAAGVWPADIAVDALQNLYVTGIYVGTVDFDPGPGTLLKTTVDNTNASGDAFVAKFTSTGDVGYVVSMGSSAGREDGNGIAVDPAGNAYVTGEFSNTMSILSPSGTPADSLNSAGSYDAYALKLTPTGDLAWAKRWGSFGGDEGLEIAFDGSGALYLTGLYTGTVDFDPGSGTSLVSSTGGYDAFVMRLGIDGSFGWAVGQGGPDYDLGTDVAINGQGEVFAVGHFSGTADFDPGPGTANLTSAGDDDGFVWKLTQGAAGNLPPTAANDAYSVDEDTTLTITAPGVLGNDSDPDGSPLSLVLVSGPSHGVLTTNSTGAFVYTPDANYNGTDLFTYRASDGSLTSDLATVTITIRPVNDLPVAADQAKTTDEDVVVSGTLTATDVDNNPLTYSIVTGPAHGTITAFNSATGAYTYRPAFNYNGTDFFTFHANDGTASSNFSNVATVSLTINPVNDAPFGFPFNQTASTNEDTAVSGQLTGRDFDNDPITFSGDVPAEGQPAHGSVVVHPDGTYTYTPAANFNGTDQFVFKVTDDKGAFGYGAVTVRVFPVNDAPVARDDAYTVTEDGVLAISTSLLSRLRMVSEPGDFVGQGSTSGTQPLVLDYTTPASSFTARVISNNGVEIRVADPSVVGGWMLDFAAPANAPLTPGVYTGALRWPFQDPGTPGLDVAGDGRGLNQLTGQFTIYEVAYGASGAVTRFAATFVQQGLDFDGSVDPPLSGAIVFNSTFGASGGVLANDTDADGDFLLTTELVTGPAHGALILNRDGTFTYTPAANFNGTDSFTYRASDGQGQSNLATVTLTVNPVNDAPTASDNAFTLNEDTPLTISPVNGVLANDTDVDGDPLTAILVDAPMHGSLTLNTDGSFSYTPNANFNGSDSFTYRANDGHVQSNLATVTLTVNPVNDAPIRADNAFTLNEDTPLTINAANGVLTNDTDVENDPLTAVLVGGPSHGTLAFNSDGSFTYTPAADFNGSDSFTYRASDGQAQSNLATVTLTVNPVNDPPVASDNAFTLNEDTPLAISAANSVLANDTDIDGDLLTTVLVSGPAHGSLTLNTDGSFTYTPAANFNGTDSFTYRASDGQAQSNLATVTLTVNPVNDPPAASNNAFALNEDSTLTISAANGVLTNDTDVENNPLTAVLVGGPAHGTLAFNSDGSFTYTPAANFNGSDSFTYRASDGQAQSNLATVTLTVNPVNDAPTASNQSWTIPENSLNGTLVGVFQAKDVDGDTLTYSFVSGNTGGAFAIDPATGRITVANSSLLDFKTTPQYAIVVSVTDVFGLSTVATATISLTDVNENAQVALDIKPGDPSNTINLKSNGKIEVAILSTADFAAQTVDIQSVRFGRTGNENSASRKPQGGIRYRLADVNSDGRLDLVVQFEIQRTGFKAGDTVGILKGTTSNGQSFTATDLVQIKQPGNRRSKPSRFPRWTHSWI